MPQTARVLLSGDLSPKWICAELQLIAGDCLAITKCTGPSEEVLAWCSRQGPCVFVVDAGSIEKTNVEEFSEAVDGGRSIRVLVEIEDDNPATTERLVRMGCAGVLNRNASPETACRAVRAVLAGELWVDRKTLSRIVQNMLRGIKCGLTPREIQILGLLTEGLKNCQIAERLFISAKTVRWHLRSLYSKLGTHDRFCVASQVSSQLDPESPRRTKRRPTENEAA
jgi:DNA-binding NarL/FixJ family response regulator